MGGKMNVRIIDLDGFGEPFAHVSIYQQDLNYLFYALSDYRAKIMREGHHAKDKVESDLTMLIEQFLDMEDEFFKAKYEEE